MPRIPERRHAQQWLVRIAAAAQGRQLTLDAPAPRYFLGVDPGMAGAVALLDAAGKPLLLADVPLRLVPGRRRAGYDLVAIRALLEPWRSGPTLAVIERPGPMPPRRPGRELGGSLANYARGVAEGWSWMLVGLGWPAHLIYEVHPRTWQAAMLEHGGEGTKERALRTAQLRWRGLDLRRTGRCRRPDPGRVDSLLIAEYGRKRLVY